jgi:hypothetical protein
MARLTLLMEGIMLVPMKMRVPERSSADGVASAGFPERCHFELGVVKPIPDVSAPVMR